MADVAKAAGVSAATVSYVLGGRNGNHAEARISEETRDRVLRAIDMTGYRVNQSARTLRRNRTDCVLLLVDRLSSPHDQRFATHLERLMENTGRTLSIMVCTESDRLRIALESVRKRHADGAVILVRELPGQQELIGEYAHLGIPIVTVSNALEPDGFDVVANDEGPALGEAVDLLAAAGHLRIAYISHEEDRARPGSRLDCIQEQLARHGLSIPEALIVPGARDRVDAYTSVRELLDRSAPPTAIISGSDSGAISAIWGVLAAGKRVPDDVAIIGCGNVDEGTITVPPLTSAGPRGADDNPAGQLLVDRLDSTETLPGRLLRRPWVFQRRGSA